MGLADKKLSKQETVIVVDDMKSAFNVPEAWFEKWGYKVVSLQAGVHFSSLDELKNQIAKHDPILVITDYSMPFKDGTRRSMNGLDTLAAAHDFNPDLPVVVHSAELNEITQPGKFKGVYDKGDKDRFHKLAEAEGMNTKSVARSLG